MASLGNVSVRVAEKRAFKSPRQHMINAKATNCSLREHGNIVYTITCQSAGQLSGWRHAHTFVTLFILTMVGEEEEERSYIILWYRVTDHSDKVKHLLHNCFIV